MAITITAPPGNSIPPQCEGGEGWRLPRPLPSGTQRTGIMLGVAAISMMFIGLSSAYIVSQGLGPLWKQIHMTPLILINTGVLLTSSYTLEKARRRASVAWLVATICLGLCFLAGQIGVFSQLSGQGFYLNTGRQSSFYYVLTGLHGLHILGGILALVWVAARIRATTLEVTSIYWHSMSGLWLYLLLVIFL